MSLERPLNASEASMERLNRAACTWNVVTMSQVSGPLSESLLRQAFAFARRRHPRLSCRIVGAPRGLRFAPGGTVSFRTQPSPWQAVAEAELNTRIDSAQGLVRLVLVPVAPETHYLITTTHHAISDAIGCVHLHAELLGYCRDLLAGVIPPVAPLPLLPSNEALIPRRYQGALTPVRRGMFLFRTALAHLWNRPAGLPIEKHVPLGERRTGLVQRILATAPTARLLERCRSEQVSVQTALCAALLITVARQIADRSNVRLSCQSYLNLRPRLENPPDNAQLALLASTCRGYYTVGRAHAFWPLARAVKRDLEAVLTRPDIFDVMAVAPWLLDYCFRFPRQIPFSTSVSNIGKVAIPEQYGPFTLEAISYAGSNALMPGVFATNVTTFRGQMHLSFIYSDPSLSRPTVEGLADFALEQLVSQV